MDLSEIKRQTERDWIGHNMMNNLDIEIDYWWWDILAEYYTI